MSRKIYWRKVVRREWRMALRCQRCGHKETLKIRDKNDYATHDMQGWDVDGKEICPVCRFRDMYWKTLFLDGTEQTVYEGGLDKDEGVALDYRWIRGDYSIVLKLYRKGADGVWFRDFMRRYNNHLPKNKMECFQWRGMKGRLTISGSPKQKIAWQVM